jgi:hypothetical protein
MPRKGTGPKDMGAILRGIGGKSRKKCRESAGFLRDVGREKLSRKGLAFSPLTLPSDPPSSVGSSDSPKRGRGV